MDLPCSRCFLWLHAGGTEPREHLRPLALSRPAIPPSPLSDRVGYSDHVRFRGYVPVHCRSGLQPPCLRFAAAVTGRHARLGSRLLARLCRGRHRRRQTSTRLQGATLIEPDRQISRIRLVWGFLCQGGVTPIWSSFAFHSFVRPAPRAFLRPDRIFPSPSRRSVGQGRRFFSAAEGLSLTDASTTAGCRRSGGWPRDDPRGACHWPRSIARTTLVFG